jgi:hypothetical protein
MNASLQSVLSTPAKPSENRARRLMARMNMTLFYCLGIAVLVEAAAEHEGRGVGVPATGRVPGRARWLREYADSVWPEFAWHAACDAFCRHRRLDGWADARTADAARRVAARHVGQYYETVSRIAEDAVLRGALGAIAAEERLGADNGMARNPVARLRDWHLARRFVDHMRDGVVRRAFEELQHDWSDAAPFPAMTYDAFLRRSWALLSQHAEPRLPTRLLHWSWLPRRRPETLSIPSQEARHTQPGFARSDARQSPVSDVLPQPAMLR